MADRVGPPTALLRRHGDHRGNAEEIFKILADF
jgi:hypothetical protein